MSKVEQNGVILAIYQAAMTNINGDPDKEDMPRLDFETQHALASDVWAKWRYRQYLELKEGFPVYYSHRLIKKYQEEDAKKNGREKGRIPTQENYVSWLLEKSPEELKELGLQMLEDAGSSSMLSKEQLQKFLDIRLFGGLCPYKKKTRDDPGESIDITGPVQFAWSYSLLPVETVGSKNIRSPFASKENKTQGSFGKKHQIYYALMPVYGFISSARADETVGGTGLTEEDLKVLDRAVIKSPYLFVSSSKTGITPLIYLRIHGNTMIPDLRDFISAEQKNKNVRSLKDVTLYLEQLKEILKQVEGLYCRTWFSPALDYFDIRGLDGLKDYLSGFSSENIL